MGNEEEYRCFVGSLSWSTTDRGLKDAFEKFGHLVEAKVVLDKFSGRSRGFGFVSFDEKRAMEEAIDAMNGIDLDGRNITVEKAQPSSGGGGGGGRGRDRDDVYDRGHDRDRGRSFGGPKGSGGGGDCFKCGKPGHFARECPSGDGGRFGGRDDRRSGGNGDHYGPDRGGDRYGGGGSGRYSSRGSSGSDRYSRDRSGPYDRPSSGSYR